MDVIYDKVDNKKFVKFLLALGHPVRVAIMAKLAKDNTCVRGELIKDIHHSDYILSMHLRALQQAGLIKGNTTINRSHYCINWDVFWEFSESFHFLFNDFEKKLVEQNCDLIPKITKK